MAYGDYGAFVYKNGKRRTDKEDVFTFPKNTAVGFTNKEMGEYWAEWIVHAKHHGIIGDGNIRVVCHKENPPVILELIDGSVKEVPIPPENFIQEEYVLKWRFSFEYKGYRFFFESGTGRENPYTAEMTEPDGTHWLCKHAYFYGAGFEDC